LILLTDVIFHCSRLRNISPDLQIRNRITVSAEIHEYTVYTERITAVGKLLHFLPSLCTSKNAFAKTVNRRCGHETVSRRTVPVLSKIQTWELAERSSLCDGAP